MKKSIVFLFFFFSLIVVSQTRQQTKQVRALDQEISRLKLDKIRLERQIQPNYAEEIKRLSCEIDSLAKMSLEGLTLPEIAKMEQETNKKRDLLALYEEKALNAQNNPQLKKQIVEKDSEISFFKGEREKIFLEFATSNQIPREMTDRIKGRRQNANVLRREEMVIEKVEGNLGSVNPQENSNGGYLVILSNQNYNDVNFSIQPIDGGDKVGHVLKGKTNLDIYLIPGRYLVTATVGGIKKLDPIIINITGEKMTIFGRECFSYALVTSTM